jgi:amino acid transporter
LLTLYGLGTILGAGIYVLVGEVAARAGYAAPSSFVLAAILAGLTAMSFAELGSRIPKSGGEAAYVLEAFRRPAFSTAVGWAVVGVGTVSAATMVHGFVGYLGVFVELPAILVLTACVAVLCAIAIWGIGESLMIAAAITVLEAFGLVFVCYVAADSFGSFAGNWQRILPDFESTQLVGVVSGAFIAFYAFIGFEDMVNIAEEVREPERNLPRAIILALTVSTALYALIAIVATFAVPQDLLAGSAAPLAVIVESRGFPPGIIAAISLLAVLNGALVQVIMASRVLYGLARDGLAPTPFARVHPRTQTPVVGTLTVAGVLLLLCFLLPLLSLARITSFIALSIFTVVNLALLRLKHTQTSAPGFSVPVIIPLTGAVLCVAMIAYETFNFLR